ncbi:MAG: glycosyltransferase [Candidatus Aadella gelida]|nr:glycosyltransferase [Candidatus Aadella gelida]
MNKKVLIFYISKLSGHFHAARAIEKGLFELDKNIQVEMINTPEYTNPILGKIIISAYHEVIKKKPEFWGNIYDNPEVMKKTEKARKTLHKFNMSKMKKLLDGFSPDIIFCTQAFPCGMVADYKRVSGKELMLVGVLTDYAPHSYWLYDEVDLYITPSEETSEMLAKKGVAAEKIRTYGIPVDPKFTKSQPADILKKQMGISKDHPVVLIMGGNQGLGSIEAAVESILNDDEHFYQLVVITGSNKKLYTKLQKIEDKKTSGSLKVLPFVDNIDEIMDIADVIITKPGGMTVAEALVKNLPMIIMKPIPGHERMNADYLVMHGAAVEVEDETKLHEKLDDLFDKGKKLNQMREQAKKIARPASTLDIARLAFIK